MASIQDYNVVEQFNSRLEEIRSKLLDQAIGEVLNDTAAELCQEHRRYMKSVLDTCVKKCKEDETMFDRIHAYQEDMKEKTSLLKEKRAEHLEVVSEIEDKEHNKVLLIQRIEKLKKDQAKNRELIQSQNKANKDRLKKLNKCKDVFQKHLSLEIRKIQGENLQFVFRNINRKDPDIVHTFLLQLDAEGVYHIISCDPSLEKIAHLERRLQETNNFSAFLANVRREFVALHSSAKMA
ncbi:kinetochore protein Spc25-like [Myxocyprinus asiaticus]|uniref:kinetochore protein Spc25-like n=1 Tax=Myxocyprinus asiaticus TaxID=70543 RepID=UPI0022220644|nr:kinetochore protein Spc25-like [Myxocyprinus asiaticus]